MGKAISFLINKNASKVNKTSFKKNNIKSSYRYFSRTIFISDRVQKWVHVQKARFSLIINLFLEM